MNHSTLSRLRSVPQDLEALPTDGRPASVADAVLGGDASKAVLKGTVARGGSYVASMALLALGFALAARELGRAGLGELTTVLSIAAVAQTLGDQALQIIGQRQLVAAPAAERPALAGMLAGVRLIIMPIAIGLTVAFGVIAGYDADMVTGIAIAGAATLMTTLGGAYQTPMAIELRVATASAIDLARHAVIAAGLLIAVALSASLIGYVAGYLVAGVVHLLLALALAGHTWRRLSLPHPQVLRGLLREISALGLAVAVNTMFLKLLIIVASLTTTREELGILAAGTRVTEMAAAVPIFMAAVAFPVLTRAAVDQDHDRLANASRRVVEGLLVLMGAAVLVLVIAAEPLIRIFAGKQFADAAPALQIQSVALLASTVTQSLIWTLIALRRERILILTNLLGLATLIAVGALLISAYGARGGAYSAVASEVVLAIATATMLRRCAPGAGPRLGRLLMVIGLLALLIAAGLSLPLPAPLSAALVLAAYGVLTWRTGLLPAELRQGGMRP